MGGRSADLLIVLAGVAVAVAAVWPIAAHWLTNPPDQRLVDLEVYREGGQAVLRGAPLYEVLTQPPQFLPFTYPPFAAVLAVPFTLMPWHVAQFVWTALIYVALVVVVRYSFRDLIARAGRWAPLATGTLVGAMAWILPDRDQVRFGQVGLFLLAMCLADCCTRSPRWPRGLLVGLAVAIKLVPGVFLIYFIITGRFRAAGNAVLTAAAATLFGFMLLPSNSVDFWFGALLQGGDRTGAIDGTTNQAINGIVARVLPDGPARTLVWFVLALALAYYGFKFAYRATRTADLLAGPSSRPFNGTDRMAAADGPASYGLLLAGAAITGLLSVMLSPVGWIHHFVWMIPVAGALVGDGRDTRRCLSGVAVWFYFLWPLPWWGARMIGPDHGYVTEFFGRVIQDLFGAAAVVSVFLLGRWLVNRTLQNKDPAVPTHEAAEVGTLSS